MYVSNFCQSFKASRSAFYPLIPLASLSLKQDIYTPPADQPDSSSRPPERSKAEETGSWNPPQGRDGYRSGTKKETKNHGGTHRSSHKQPSQTVKPHVLRAFSSQGDSEGLFNGPVD